MLGVLSKLSDKDVVGEFFELFKTPWEFCRKGKQYDTVICSGDVSTEGVAARLLIVYSAEKTPFDTGYGIQSASTSSCTHALFSGTLIPLYGSALTFPSTPSTLLETPSGDVLAYASSVGPDRYVRVGYDLFAEIRAILGSGQPPLNASSPTLDLHIALLRHLITSSGSPLAEIPPIPAGYPFMVCLTHDMDHALIRRHRFDATMLGFIYRATVASVMRTARGRLPARGLIRNWAAVAKLPLVYLGVAADFWYQFDRYLDLEKGRPSTFFVIPFAGRPGRSLQGKAPGARASRYGVSDIAEKVRFLSAAGSEIGLHGIDAWVDTASGREEAKRIADAGVERPQGVRMHWLYSDENSWRVLENADFVYDSTMGYNETVGFRAGTSQVFKPLGASRLRELPMQIMDTALFYPDYLNLSEEEAWSLLSPILDNTARYGGVLTINWHDRSIAPERLWDGFYSRLLADLTRRGALFCTGSDAVAWFQKRRSVSFEELSSGEIRATVCSGMNESVPDMRLRIYSPCDSHSVSEKKLAPERYQETIFSDRAEFRLAS
ncbi:MAG TPA: hypothetical protein VFR18_16130 [Terriglobia bacterium]|nr:hypothetical protein [Terriglobia bacterium]